jgi:hypothetical protein
MRRMEASGGRGWDGETAIKRANWDVSVPPRSSRPTARTDQKNVLWRAVDVNRPVRPSSVPVAVLAARARTVTGGLTSHARLVTWGTVRETTASVLSTVSPSQGEAGMVKRR